MSMRIQVICSDRQSHNITLLGTNTVINTVLHDGILDIGIPLDQFRLRQYLHVLFDMEMAAGELQTVLTLNSSGMLVMTLHSNPMKCVLRTTVVEISLPLSLIFSAFGAFTTVIRAALNFQMSAETTSALRPVIHASTDMSLNLTAFAEDAVNVHTAFHMLLDAVVDAALQTSVNMYSLTEFGLDAGLSAIMLMGQTLFPSVMACSAAIVSIRWQILSDVDDFMLADMDSFTMEELDFIELE